MRAAIAVLFDADRRFDRRAIAADLYRMCAQYKSKSGGGGGGAAIVNFPHRRSNGMAAVSGNGGFCNPNNFYDGCARFF